VSSSRNMMDKPEKDQVIEKVSVENADDIEEPEIIS
jgi:hypothetical protein